MNIQCVIIVLSSRDNSIHELVSGPSRHFVDLRTRSSKIWAYPNLGGNPFRLSSNLYLRWSKAQTIF